MGVVSVSLPSDGSTGTVSQYNTPLTTIVNEFNGNIDNANIKANAAIASSKLATGIPTSMLANPYKFNVYLASAQNVGTANTRVSFDSRNFDTGTNVDITTNKGRFTAPVAGFYQFSANILTTSTGSGTSVAMAFYKNGTQVTGIIRQDVTSGLTPGLSLSTLLQLALNDYVEVYVGTGAAAKALDVGLSSNNTFSGFLVSVT
jgi:hypothetical protein